MILFIVFFVTNVVSSSFAIHPDAYRTTQEMAIAHGFSCENYTAVTYDGYLLTVFRMWSEDSPKHRTPIILQHGLLDTSDTYLINEDPALGYIFAKQGFDVWLSNFRGNRYGRRHLYYDPNVDSKYWDFGVDEIIAYDLKAIFNLIISISGREKVHYIGHSMGAGSIVAAAAQEPEFYGARLKSVISLSPATSLVNSEFFAHFAKQFPVQLPFKSSRGELYFYEITKTAMRQICHIVPSVCAAATEIFIGSGKRMNKEKIEVLVSRAPDVTSDRLLKHLLQQTERPGFFRYRKYGSTSPRIPYDLSAFPADRVPLLLVGSKGDRMVSHEDVRWLKNTIEKNGKKVGYKEYDEIGHITYMLLKNDKEVYEDLLNFVLKHN